MADGQHGTIDVMGSSIDRPNAKPLTCQVTSVNRMASS
jgi:hypothetical protein